MSETLTIKGVFSEGNSNNCNHDWVYAKPNRIIFAYPQTVLQERMCKDCFRTELVEVMGRQITGTEEEYNETYAKMIKNKRGD